MTQLRVRPNLWGVGRWLAWTAVAQEEGGAILCSWEAAALLPRHSTESSPGHRWLFFACWVCADDCGQVNNSKSTQLTSSSLFRMCRPRFTSHPLVHVCRRLFNSEVSPRRITDFSALLRQINLRTSKPLSFQLNLFFYDMDVKGAARALHNSAPSSTPSLLRNIAALSVWVEFSSMME